MTKSIEEIGEEALQVLQETLRRAGEVREHKWVRGKIGTEDDPGYDLRVLFRMKQGQGQGRGDEWKIHAIVKAVAHPKQVRQAIWELSKHSSRGGAARSIYPLLIAPFISQASAQICDEAQIGYLDLSGNCDLHFGGIWIHLEKKENKYKEPRSIKNLYSSKSSRILRLLLQGPLVGHKVEDLAREADVSLGLVSKVRRHLLDQELAKKTPEGICIKSASQILSGWLLADDLEDRTESREYALLEIDPLAIAQNLSKLLDDNSIPHAYTQWFAGWLRAPHVIPPVISAYVKVFPDEGLLKSKLNASRVGARAGRLCLLKDKDFKGVTLGGQTIKEFPLVSDIQIYLDLLDAGQHGSEQAQKLRENVDFSGGWR